MTVPFTRAEFVAAYAAALPAPFGFGGWNALPAAQRAEMLVERIGEPNGPALRGNATLRRVAAKFGIRTERALDAAFAAIRAAEVRS